MEDCFIYVVDLLYNNIVLFFLLLKFFLLTVECCLHVGAVKITVNEHCCESCSVAAVTVTCL